MVILSYERNIEDAFIRMERKEAARNHWEGYSFGHLTAARGE